MKKMKYESPEMEIITFTTADIITASTLGEEETPMIKP